MKSATMLGLSAVLLATASVPLDGYRTQEQAPWARGPVRVRPTSRDDPEAKPRKSKAQRKARRANRKK